MSEHVNTCFTWPRKTLSWLKWWEKMTCNSPVKLEEPIQLWLKWRAIGYLSLRGILTYVKEETKCDQGVFAASKSDVALPLYQTRICREYSKDFRSSAVVDFNNQKPTFFASLQVVTDYKTNLWLKVDVLYKIYSAAYHSKALKIRNLFIGMKWKPENKEKNYFWIHLF